MHPKLRQVAIQVIAEYMGVAAEFVVDDALDIVSATPSADSTPEMHQIFFFVELAKLLPPEIPYTRVKLTIANGLK